MRVQQANCNIQDQDVAASHWGTVDNTTIHHNRSHSAQVQAQKTAALTSSAGSETTADPCSPATTEARNPKLKVRGGCKSPQGAPEVLTIGDGSGRRAEVPTPRALGSGLGDKDR